jgi:DNA-binding transcriptional ArsR family regulator
VSVLALLTDAAGRRRGAPETWRRRIRSAVRPGAVPSVLPIVDPRYSVTPDCVTPQSPACEIPVGEQLTRLRELSEADLLKDLQDVFGGQPPPNWREALSRPRHWLRSYADAMTDAWQCVEPLWRQARPLLDREVERVGAAAVRGQLGLILDGLHPASRFADGVLSIRDPEPGRFSLCGRDLILVPMLAGPQALICNLERDDGVWIGYPLPRTAGTRRGSRKRTAVAGPLAAMIGPVRAGLLDATERPLTMGDLAARAGLPPSAITYHCDRLAASGLIDRERRGREVWVSRTRLGDTLAEMFSSGS